MAFYKSKKLLLNSILSLMSLIAIGLAFQNCSSGLSSSSPALSNATSDTPGGMRVISDDNTGSSTTTGSTELKIELLATDLLKVDCSLPGSGYKFELSNASTDITMCQEYTLDMPQGNARYGESYKCNSSDKFRSPPGDWSYDSLKKQWSKTTATSGHQYIPGDYRLYVRDNLGEVKSSLLKIRHYGYANCVNPVIAEQPGTGGGSVNTGGGGGSSGGGTTSVVTSCSWSGEDFSPAQPPQSVCSQSRANAKENGASGVEYTCVCTQATVILPPSSGAGSTTGGGSNTTPSPTPTPNASGACNPPGTTLVDVQTTTPHPRTIYRPTPSTVYAFAFKTVHAGGLATGRLSVNVIASATSGKLIVISDCRGDVSAILNSEKTQGCVVFGSEAATLGYTINASPKVKPDYWCNLKPNTQYYLNVIGRSEATGSNLCPSSAVCGFDFEKF